MIQLGNQWHLAEDKSNLVFVFSKLIKIDPDETLEKQITLTICYFLSDTVAPYRNRVIHYWCTQTYK